MKKDQNIGVYNSGLYTHNSNQSYFVPVAGSAVFELNGNENETDRTIKFVGYANSNYKQHFKRTTLIVREL